jgi:5-hydroxyisourate hydrolase-like protein (transthyretin family)
MRIAFTIALALCAACLGTAQAAATLQGRVLDVNGKPVPQVQVILERATNVAGANVVTVFSDSDGRFRFPESYAELTPGSLRLATRSLGYRLADTTTRIQPARQPGISGAESLDVTLVMKREDNQVAAAPASAWLGRITDRAQKSKFIMDCIDCHQVPASEQRAYAASIADQHATDPVLARSESWKMIVKYMNYLSTWEFSRGKRDKNEKVDADAVYSVNNGDDVSGR